LLYLSPKSFQEPTITFHIKFNLTNNIFGWEFGLTKSQQNLPLGVIGTRHNLLGPPSNLIIFEGIGSRYRLTIEYNKIFMQIDINIKLIDLIFPFLIDFILESKLNITRINLHGIDK